MIQAVRIDSVFSIFSLARKAVICHFQDSQFLNLHWENKLEIPKLFPIKKKKKKIHGKSYWG